MLLPTYPFLLLLSLASAACAESPDVIAHRPRHVRHIERSYTPYQHKRDAISNLLSSASLLQGATNFAVCQISTQLQLAVIAMGVAINRPQVCSAPGSTPTVAAQAIAIVPAAPVAPTQAPIVAPFKIVTPVVAVTPTASLASLAASIGKAILPMATPAALVSDPCISTDPEVCHQRELAMEAHNKARASHHAPALVWSNDLAAKALTWADHCVWKHSGGSLYPPSYVYGENLYSSTLEMGPSGTGTEMTIATSAFTNEESLYDYKNPQYSDETGHFTQVVWVATKQMGCAIINCNLDIFQQYTNSSAYVVCFVALYFLLSEYYPSGNYYGEFAANVLAP